MDHPAKLLRLGKLRVTVPRLSVLELFGTHARLTPREAYSLLDDGSNTLGPTTVHRVLAELCNAGLLVRHYLGPGLSSFSLPRQAIQAHLVCQRCGSIQTYEDAILQEVVDRVSQAHRFEVSESTVSLRGTCAACSAQRR